jgi:hypothetical protein
VETLQKSIAADWYEIRAKLDDPEELVEYLELAPHAVSSMRESLRLSVEEGVVGFKKELLHSIMTPLKSLKWNSKAITSLSETIDRAAMLTLMPALQRLLALGYLRTGAEREERQKREAADREQARQQKEHMPDIKEMVADVKERIKNKPELKNHQEVNRIFVQLKYYNSQLEKMRSLQPGIPKEKQQSFLSNFQQTFREIHERIYNSYTALLREIDPPKEKPASSKPMLKRYTLTPAEPIYRSQCEEAARLYSSLSFAERERYNTREFLLELTAGEGYYSAGFDRELEKYRTIAPFGRDYLQLSVAIGEALHRYLERFTVPR